MMINEFGVPMNDIEMHMTYGHKPHINMLAESGREMNFFGGLVGGLVGAFFGSKSRKVVDTRQQQNWKDSAEYKQLMSQNQALTSQIQGLEGSISSLRSTFQQRAAMDASTIQSLTGVVTGFKEEKAAEQKAAAVQSGYGTPKQDRNKGVKIKKGKTYGKEGKVGSPRAYFGREGDRLSQSNNPLNLTQSVNV